MAESCTICSSRSTRPVRKLLDTPSYTDGSLVNESTDCAFVCVSHVSKFQLNNHSNIYTAELNVMFPVILYISVRSRRYFVVCSYSLSLYSLPSQTPDHPLTAQIICQTASPLCVLLGTRPCWPLTTLPPNMKLQTVHHLVIEL
jgi:hypothetical protein